MRENVRRSLARQISLFFPNLVVQRKQRERNTERSRNLEKEIERGRGDVRMTQNEIDRKREKLKRKPEEVDQVTNKKYRCNGYANRNK